MTDAALVEQKTALRAAMRRRLASLTSDERAERSKRIVRRIVELPSWRNASRVLLFAPLPIEPDLDLLWLDGALDGKEVAYPRVEGMTIRSYYVESLNELEPTRWGLREPRLRAAREAMLSDFGIVLVPGLAFDVAGGRLGRGGGFYDRLLAKRPAGSLVVGVGFGFQQIPEEVPQAEHDVPLDAVCTDDIPPLG